MDKSELIKQIETSARAQSEEMYDYGVVQDYKVFVFNLTNTRREIEDALSERFPEWKYELRQRENGFWDLIIDF